MKMPEPIIEPITSVVASISPRPLTRPACHELLPFFHPLAQGLRRSSGRAAGRRSRPPNRRRPLNTSTAFSCVMPPMATSGFSIRAAASPDLFDADHRIGIALGSGGEYRADRHVIHRLAAGRAELRHVVAGESDGTHRGPSAGAHRAAADRPGRRAARRPAAARNRRGRYDKSGAGLAAQARHRARADSKKLAAPVALVADLQDARAALQKCGGRAFPARYPRVRAIPYRESGRPAEASLIADWIMIPRRGGSCRAPGDYFTAANTSAGLGIPRRANRILPSRPIR